MTPNTIFKALVEGGLGAEAAALVQLAAPSVRLDPVRCSLDALRIGASRLGGVPDLPSGLEWPTRGGVPLSLIAQLDLADLARFPACSALPPAGHLAFFYDAVNQPWGSEREDRGSAPVLFIPPGVALVRAAPSRFLPEDARFSPCSLTFAERLTMPSFESPHIDALRLSVAQSEAYGDFQSRLSDLEGARMVSQLFGHPDEVQGAMQAWIDRDSGHTDPRDWRLLLQVDSESAAGMMWGDVGRIYWWIRRDDLRDRRFDRTWLVLQCC